MHEIIYAIKTKSLDEYNRYCGIVYTALGAVISIGIVTISFLLYQMPEAFVGVGKFNRGHFLTVFQEYKMSLAVLVLLLLFTSWTFALITRYALDIMQQKEISYKQLITSLKAVPVIFLIMTLYSVFWALYSYAIEFLFKQFEQSSSLIDIASPYMLGGLMLGAVGFLIVGVYIHVRFIYYINFSLFLLVDEKKSGLRDLGQLQKTINKNADMLNQLYIFTGRRWPLWMFFPVNILQLGLYRYIIDAHVYQLLMNKK